MNLQLTIFFTSVSMLKMATFLSAYAPERGQCEPLTLRKAQLTGNVSESLSWNYLDTVLIFRK